VNASKSSTVVTLNNPDETAVTAETEEISDVSLGSDSEEDEEEDEDEDAETETEDGISGLLHDEDGYYYEVDLGSSSWSGSKWNGTISVSNQSKTEAKKTIDKFNNKNLDLSQATKIQIVWANTTKGTYWEKKKCKKVTSSGYYTDGYNWITFGGSSTQYYKYKNNSSNNAGDIRFGSSSSYNTDTYTVPESARKTNGSIVIHTKTSGSNKYSNLAVSSLKVYVYTPYYMLNVSSGTATAGKNNDLNNSYIDVKTWTVEKEGSQYSQDKVYNNAWYTQQGKTNILAGTVTMSNVKTSGSSKYATYGSSVIFNASIAKAYVDRVYLAGIYMTVGSQSEFIKATDNSVKIDFDSKFADKYAGNRYTDKTVTIVPCYYARSAFIYFPQTTGGQIVNHGSENVNDIMKVSMVDTVNLRAAADEGKYVAGFSVKTSKKGSSSGKDDQFCSNDASAYSKSIAEFREQYITKPKNNRINSAVAEDSSCYTWSESNSAVITIDPTSVVTKVTPYYGVPYLNLRANPRNAYKDQGVVYYVESGDEDAEDADAEAQVASVDKDGNVTSIVINPMNMGATYTFNSIANDGYVTKWQDFTGDTNYDGYLSLEEQASDVEIDRSAVVGSTYYYLAKYTAIPIIYYGFYKESDSLAAGIVSGAIYLKKQPVFSTYSTTEAVEGATVTVGNKTDVTNEKGVYYITDENYGDSDRAAVSVFFDNYTYNFVQNVNAAAKVTIDEYDTISVTDASIYKYDATNDAYAEIDASALQNFDKNVKIELGTKADSDVLYANTAVFNTYDRNGNLV
ncbi:MAG: hypothetical protein LUH47_00915, partial [Clostridiales bacterium]|nr:hypothetical protein [Clostridiales bacterium]